MLWFQVSFSEIILSTNVTEYQTGVFYVDNFVDNLPDAMISKLEFSDLKSKSGNDFSPQGWQYANDFYSPFSSERRLLSLVRRRKWIRFRRFSALDRWLYIHSPYEDHTLDPFVK